VLVGKAADEHAAVVAKPGVIFECSFSFESDYHESCCLRIDLQKYEKKSYLCILKIFFIF